MNALELSNEQGSKICIGYRSPGLSASHTPKQKMALAQELGMGVIEPQFAAKEFSDPQMPELMAEASKAYGIEIPSMGCELYLTTPNNMTATRERLDELLRAAKTMGVNYIFSRVLYPPEGVNEHEAWVIFTQQARQVATLLEDEGITWALEADGGTFVQNLERTVRALDLIDHPNVLPNLDLANLYMGGSDPYQAIATLGPSAISGHIKDAVYIKGKGREVPVGTGELDWNGYLSHLLKDGCSMNLFIEHCQTREDVISAVQHLREVVDGLD